MKISSFFKKYNGKVVEDAGTRNSKEFIQFSKDMKATIKEICNNQEAELVEWSVGHYSVSGFIKKNERFVYISYDEPRGFPLDLNANHYNGGILIRTAKHEKDYSGGCNNFCNIHQVGDMINRLTSR